MPGCRVLALAMAGMLALGGCGTGGRASGSRTSDPARSGTLHRRLAQCYRAHGAPDFPDPVRDPKTGRWQPPKTASPPPAAAVKACKPIGDQIAKAEWSNPPTAAEAADLRAFAACMRAHGVRDWPSPGPDGVFTLPPRLGRLGDKGLATQIAACTSQLPPRGFRVTPKR